MVNRRRSARSLRTLGGPMRTKDRYARVAFALLAAAGCRSVIGFEDRTFVECAVSVPACEGNGVVTCEGGRWSEPIACEGDTTCVEGACLSHCPTEGERRCQDDTPEECSDGLWTPEAPCSSPFPVCVAGECQQALLPLPWSGGHSQTCVVGSAGGVYCWGDNAGGQLGSSDLEPQPFPTRVQGLPDDVVEVALGWLHTCARTNAGEVWCWGTNDYGELGSGNPGGPPQAPAKVVGIPPAKHVRASSYRTCILGLNGEAWCFGLNNNGQISVPSDEDAHAPTLMPGLTGVASLVMGTVLTCGVRGDGTAACAGESAPQKEVPLDDVIELHMNDLHQCAIRQTKHAACWGIDQFGEIGNGLPLAALTSPETLLPLNVDDVATGWRHTCLLSAGVVSCVGYGLQGQLGNGAASNYETEFVEVSLPGPASDITSNFGAGCAILGPRELYCWGQNNTGGVGDGTLEDRPTPVPIAWDAADID